MEPPFKLSCALGPLLLRLPVTVVAEFSICIAPLVLTPPPPMEWAVVVSVGGCGCIVASVYGHKCMPNPTLADPFPRDPMHETLPKPLLCNTPTPAPLGQLSTNTWYTKCA